MVALVSTQGEISYSETTGGWTGDTFSTNPDIKTQGSNSVECAQTTNGTNEIYNAGSWNLSGTHLRLSINFSFIGNMATSNPVYVFVEDGTNRDDITYFTSSSDYSGGWVDMVLDTALFTTVTLSSATRVGFGVTTSSKPRNVPANTWVDNWRFSNGYSITSSTTETVSFEQVATEDASNVYGVLVNTDGVLFASGEILLGSTGSANANIVSSNEQIVFADRQVDSALYKLKSQEGTGNTDIDISGLVCKTVGGSGAELDFSSNLNSFSLTGSTFIDMGSMTFTPTVTSPTFNTTGFTNCGTTSLSIPATSISYSGCGLITLTGSGTLTNCTITNSTSSVSVSTSDLGDTTGCTFTSDGSNHAADLGTVAATTSMTWNNTLSGYASTDGSTGNEAILVNVASGQTLTINVSGGSTPSVYNTGAGSFTVDAAVDVILTGLVAGTEIHAYTGVAGAAAVEIGTGVENSGTSYTFSQSVGGTNGFITLILPGYKPLTIEMLPYSSSEQSIPVQQTLDRGYNNP